jgi:RNA polymerase sigma-70 factor (ECF subfamily)
MSWRRNPELVSPAPVVLPGDRADARDRAAALAALSDEQLMAAVVRRDQPAFDVLYDRYAALVYSASLRVLGDPQLAEDATQDVFVRLWRRPEAYTEDRGRFLSWFMSVVRNRAVDELRSRGRRQRHEGANGPDGPEEALAGTPAHDGDPELEAEQGEARSAIRAALCSLPRDQRLVLELAYFSGMTQQEIALALHEPLGTVKTRIRLGMQKLRRALHDQV